MASCYNAMRLGGGIHTLVRLNLRQLALQTQAGLETFLDEVIPHAASLQAEVIESRIRFLIEETGWFEKDIFIQEGLLHADRFTAYAGVYGLAEAVQTMMERQGLPEARYGHHPAANEAAARITQRLGQEVNRLPLPYCEATGRVTPACMPRWASPATWASRPAAVCRPAASRTCMRTCWPKRFHSRPCRAGSAPSSSSTRPPPPTRRRCWISSTAHLQPASATCRWAAAAPSISASTGYLIRRADLEAQQKEKALRHDSSMLGSEFIAHQQNTLHRRTRQV